MPENNLSGGSSAGDSTTTVDPDGFGSELGGDPVDSGNGNTDPEPDGEPDDDPNQFRDEIGGDPVNSGGRNTGGGTRPDPEPVDRGTRTTDEIRSDIGGAVDAVGDRVTDAGSDIRDAAGDVVDAGGGSTPPQRSLGPMNVGERTDTDTLRRGVNTDAPGIQAPEPDREITNDLTRGGVLSETRGGDSGLLPGEVGGVDVSEDRLRNDAENIDEELQDAFNDNPELTVAGSDLPDRVITGGATAASGVLNVPGLIVGAETATEVATNAPGEIREEGAGAVGATALGVGASVGASAVDSAQENPAEFAGGAVFNVAAGAGIGRSLGTAGRGLGDRVRTAGGTRVDARDLASDDVVRFTETDGAEGERFPGADDPDLFQTDPAEAVRTQSERNTPTEVDDVFGGGGVDDGTTLTKALDTEPEGPARGRSDTGFSSAPGETAEDFDFETPGSFFGPELSPNFLRTGGGEASMSLRPGLPDFGNRPTAVMARTDVENPDADDLEGFNAEMIERGGDTTAVTKPASEVNPGEIEAVVPPGAEFAPVGSGGLRGVARRFGVGSDLYTEVDGRRVPIRTVAPADEIGDAADDAAGAAARADAPDPEGAPLSSYVEAPSDPVDRPVPVAGGGPLPFGGSPEADPGALSPGFEPSIPGSSPPPSGGSGGGGGSGGSGGPFGGSGGLPGSGGSGGGSDPTTSTPGGSGTPSDPGPSSPFGTASVGSPTVTSEGSGAGGSDPVTDPVFGVPAPAGESQPRRRRDDDTDDGDEPDPLPFVDDRRAPETVGFSNPIAGFELFGP